MMIGRWGYQLLQVHLRFNAKGTMNNLFKNKIAGDRDGGK
jgi:hypothetical protein